MTARPTSFTERMVGPVTAVDWAVPVTLPARGPRCGDGVRAQAESYLADAVGTGAPTRTLDLDALELVVDPAPDRYDGYRAEIVGGRATGLGAGLDGPIVAGFADLLLRARTGRRFSYRMLVDGGAGNEARWRIVEGIKSVAGGARRAWPETTTLYTRVLRPVSLAGTDELGSDFGRTLSEGVAGEIPAAFVEFVGVLRIRPADLFAQGCSMRGGVLPFLAGFGARIVDRGIVR
ncbi:hypothetical protein SAMN06295974_2917 [Plantibacter flavus]|uniref:Uncharacterized protein n=1 Tax=Plantibacter flavus TaxID=150123 RepID=A0A3N2C5N9_9MICO|nr:hypothetical protein [Plantibacter flavus]ROR82819.1 hypothetical protein EDD42_2915 [Plantibacter flavus]SMG40390.1 hypothetical protein SAMN06295974_2917 [Plantibacter flavus]